MDADLAGDLTEVETDEVHSWFSFSWRSSAAEFSEQYATARSGGQPLHPIFFVELFYRSNKDCVLLWIAVKGDRTIS